MKRFISHLSLIFAVSAWFSAWAGPADKTLDIYWVDSEGGGSTLIVTPKCESVLIDSGNPGGRDAGRIYKVASETAGLKRIDYLVTTHFHTDHFGGAAPDLRLWCGRFGLLGARCRLLDDLDFKNIWLIPTVVQVFFFRRQWN